MRLDIRVPVGRPIPVVVDFIARCEEAGLDGVGVHDHPHSARGRRRGARLPHTVAGAYEMPEAEVVRRVIRPRLGG
jgi:hypothetical protein